jgi:uncharacterized protein YciI/ketosteroid isomerase-like protein
MQFIVEYRQQGSNEERDRHRDAHIAFRVGLGEKLLLAGPLLSTAGTPTGSLIILEAEDEDAARGLATDDPFVKAAVLEVLSVRPFRVAHLRSSGMTGQSAASPDLSPRKVAAEFLDRMQRKDFDGALSLAADDARFQGPDGSTVDKQLLLQVFSTVGPHIVGPFGIEVIGSSGEGKKVAVEANVSAKLANGHHYRNNYAYIFEVTAGKIVSLHEYCCTKRAEAFMLATKQPAD